MKKDNIIDFQEAYIRIMRKREAEKKGIATGKKANRKNTGA